ncbi:S-layer homology domain-containing protein [Lysinibacillus piscis]|uniref:SLH domain-containing protein n=1 Tax=Lysinibacillus piscis TaxID=2518931 RepID=A0ABQ5NKW8_9BACI|nr:S-layer homology domain-containing protein [Lysinibacillus sp. KH24]GLC89008.1 hypothetical protein LYSBPC_21350 [Lysinibacillus sp. KH24]
MKQKIVSIMLSCMLCFWTFGLAESTTASAIVNSDKTLLVQQPIMKKNYHVQGLQTMPVTKMAISGPTFTASPATVTFSNLVQGYRSNDTLTIQQYITLTKIGLPSEVISNVRASLSGGASTSFIHGTVPLDTLGAGVGSTVLNIRPKVGLAPGTYTETLTLTADGGLSESVQISFTVNPLIHAATPTIHSQPSTKNVFEGELATLSVNASISDSGTLNYQWFSNTVDNTSGGTPILDANSASYTVPTNTIGTTYYYVGLINTNNNVNGTKTASIFSNTAQVTVKPITDAVIPLIHSQPLNKTVYEEENVILTVDASVNDGGNLSYQWYSHTNNSTMGGTLIHGATNASYTVPTNVSGTMYYYVVVTNTNLSVGGVKTATAISNVAQVTVKSLVTAVTDAKAALTIGYTAADNVLHVTQPLQLATAGLHDTAISWTSSNPSVIQPNGVVMRPTYGDSSVTLTATIRKGSVTDTKIFTVIVKGFNDFTPSPMIEESVNTREPLTITMAMGNDQMVSRVEIKRVENADGTWHDTITFTTQNMIEMLAKLTENNANTVYMLMPDMLDRISQIDISIPRNALTLLQNSDVHLIMETQGVSINISNDSLDIVEEDLYFRIIPIKTQAAQQAIEERARIEEQVKNLVGVTTIELLGRPMKIETNLQNRPVTLTLPLPSAITQQQLEHLVVYIEHSDGTKEVIQGQVVPFDDKTSGLQFDVDKFSTFSTLYVPEDDPIEPPNQEDTIQVPYIKGYADGTFRPDMAVTRAQIASMFARYVTNNNIPEATVTFADTEEHDAKNAIEYVRTMGLFNGISSTTFNPNGTMTRAQMATVAMRWIEANCLESHTAAFCLEPTTDKIFTDVAPNDWAANAIQQISALGIMTGVDSATFKPNSTLTRAQAVKVLNRLFELELLTTVDTASFTDVTPAHWAFYEIQTAVKNSQ